MEATYGFGRFWNGLRRRKMIAKKFYYTGCKVAWKEAMKIRLRPRK